MNKNLMFAAIAALTLPLISCQEEVEGIRTGMVDYTITAGLPTAIGTYATNQGGLNNVKEDEYDLKYTMEVWKGNDKVYTATQTKETGFKEPVNFNVRLAATQYDFVFFAEFVKEGTNESLYAHSDLSNIEMYKRIYGNEAADSYYANVDINLSQASVAKSVTLKRKMGKIRLLATDVLTENATSVIPKTAKITYVNETVPTTFNALTGEVSGSIENEEFTFTVPVDKESFNNSSAYVIGFDYILPSAEQTAYAFKVQVLDEAGNQIGYREVSNIPVVENKLTTVFGNFFSNEGNLTVSVDDAFENKEDTELIVASPDMDLAKIVADAPAGATIQLIAGEYTCPKGILINKPVKIIGASNHGSVITSAKEAWATIWLKGNVAGTTIDGVKIYGAYKNNLSGSSDAIALWCTGTKEAPVTIKNCIIEKPAETDPSIDGRYLGISSTYGDFQHFVIEDNVINNANYGMYLCSVSNSIIENNTINNTRRGGIVIGADGNEQYKCYNVQVSGNTLTGISQAGKNAVYDYALAVAGTYGENLTEGNNDVTYAPTANEEIAKVKAYGFDKIRIITISNRSELIAALENQADGQIWHINAGTYDVTEKHDIAAYGTLSSRFVITANNLTINGIGNPVILASTDGRMQGGLPNVWQTNQGSTILVYGSNVTIDGLTVRGIDCSKAYNNEPSGNKAIAATSANNFTLKNSTILPAENKQGGSLLFDGEWSGKSALVENTKVFGAVITKYMAPSDNQFKEQVVTLKNVEIDPCMNDYYNGPLSLNSKDVIKVDGYLKLHIYEYMTQIEGYSLQQIFDGFPAYSTVVLHDNIQGPIVNGDPYYTNTLKLDKAMTVTCANGATLSGIIVLNAPIVLDNINYSYNGKNTTYGNFYINSEDVVIKNSTLYANFDMLHSVAPNNDRDRSGEFGFIRPNSHNLKLLNNTVQTNAMGMFGGNLINAEINGNTFRNLDNYTTRTVWLNDAGMQNVTIKNNIIYNRHMVLGGQAYISGNKFLNLGENGTSANAFYFWNEFTGTFNDNTYTQVVPGKALATARDGISIPEIK